ncbi:MAG: hypothetical protein O3B70_01445 [Bacteroidetes bacterium]|nr:hypothetical protein [Bacteroidota bacterium]MDA0902974.1 hypothetical protein [Bacteroidota bacterium]MDA1241610.1 hypothetical protein [Bacteroidota bacterium]
MDYAFERDWIQLLALMEERFGEQPDITSMVFAVGLQEAGQGAREFKKDEKIDLMHVGVCTLLEPLGYYVREGEDEDGWPHFVQGEPMPALTHGEQERMMRRALLHYFAAWLGREVGEEDAG